MRTRQSNNLQMQRQMRINFTKRNVQKLNLSNNSKTHFILNGIKCWAFICYFIFIFIFNLFSVADEQQRCVDSFSFTHFAILLFFVFFRRSFHFGCWANRFMPKPSVNAENSWAFRYFLLLLFCFFSFCALRSRPTWNNTYENCT